LNAVGRGAQGTAADDEASAVLFVRADDSFGDAEAAGEFERGGLLGDERVGAAFEQAGAFVQASYTFGAGGVHTNAASPRLFKAPAAASLTGWSGFYVGVAGGGTGAQSTKVYTLGLTVTYQIARWLIGSIDAAHSSSRSPASAWIVPWLLRESNNPSDSSATCSTCTRSDSY